MRTPLKTGILLLSALAGAACGRSPLGTTDCMVQVDVTDLDFGDVLPGDTSTRRIRVMNVGEESCPLTSPRLNSATDAWFSVEGDTSTKLLPPHAAVSYDLSFRPMEVLPPLSRTGEFQVDIAGTNPGHLRFPLKARVKSECRLGVTPLDVDFGIVALDSSASRSVRVVNLGRGLCEITGLALDKAGDAQFTLTSQNPTLTYEAGGPYAATVMDIGVAFTPVATQPPRNRTSTLIFSSNDENQPTVRIPLRAAIDVGCVLTVTPSSVDFQKVTLNKTAVAQVTLRNSGTSACNPVDYAFTPDSHRDFAVYPPGTEPPFIPTGTTLTLGFSFTAADILTPHQKHATFLINVPTIRPIALKIPLTATVDTICKEESRWVYTLDSDNTFSRFDPQTKTFTTITRLSCPTNSSPNSMAVDQEGVAWVAYIDGNLFRVDVNTGRCEATEFVPNQKGLLTFGMGFVFDPTTNTDTLYIAGGESTSLAQSTLAIISFPDLRVATRGTVTAGMPELSGTGDGSLWGFVPSFTSTEHAALIRLDPKTGSTLETYNYPELDNRSGNNSWAMKFWGGSFWIFLNRAVYEVKRETPTQALLVTPDSGHNVVGAGVSSCAPLRK